MNQIGWLSKALKENLQLPNSNQVLGSTTVYSCNGELCCEVSVYFLKPQVMVMVLTNIQFENCFSYYRFTVSHYTHTVKVETSNALMTSILVLLPRLYLDGYLVYIIRTLDTHNFTVNWIYYFPSFWSATVFNSNYKAGKATGIIQIQPRPSGKTTPARLTEKRMNEMKKLTKLRWRIKML